MTSPLILVVDDDPTVAEVVAGYLVRAGFRVDRAADGPGALERAGAERPDLVVLDLMLPGLDGLEVFRRLPPVPVVMLTAKGQESDRILGLEMGADDYVTKPFSPRELVLRVQSVLRREERGSGHGGGGGDGRDGTGAVGGGGGPAGSRPGPEAGPLRSGDLALHREARRVFRSDRELSLTSREFELLAFFLEHPGVAFSREELMRRVWGWDFGDMSTVTVHVRRLREKVEDDPAQPLLITTVWGVGYRFDPAGPEPGPAVPPTAPGEPAL
ncbi:response regulator transcription factor [Phaeacidiphilus oryzae]|uniref:response regulator transcription factor n=1 Tax=Phaeacidiphilus oryzae TaxID=348818 RepID=UPI00068C2551|nr:response regulator transcription factor [Phaeacidiphilus oryzae]